MDFAASVRTHRHCRTSLCYVKFIINANVGEYLLSRIIHKNGDGPTVIGSQRKF